MQITTHAAGAIYDVTNAALKWNVNPGVPQAWVPGGAAAPMRFTNNVLVAERDNAYYRAGANHSRGGGGASKAGEPFGLGNPAITWNGYTPAVFERNVVVVDAAAAPSRGAWFEGRPCAGDHLQQQPPPGTARCSWDLGDNFGNASLDRNVWFNRTATTTTTVTAAAAAAASINTPTFPGGCDITASSCGAVKGCACRTWAQWQQEAGEDAKSLWQVDPQLQGPLKLVSSPAALALGIQPLTQLDRAGADWEPEGSRY